MSNEYISIDKLNEFMETHECAISAIDGHLIVITGETPRGDNIYVNGVDLMRAEGYVEMKGDQ